MTDTTGPLPERVEAMRTSPRFFAVLGVQPSIGRHRPATRNNSAARPTVVLSDAFWRQRFTPIRRRRPPNRAERRQPNDRRRDAAVVPVSDDHDRCVDSSADAACTDARAARAVLHRDRPAESRRDDRAGRSGPDCCASCDWANSFRRPTEAGARRWRRCTRNRSAAYGGRSGCCSAPLAGAACRVRQRRRA